MIINIFHLLSVGGKNTVDAFISGRSGRQKNPVGDEGLFWLGKALARILHARKRVVAILSQIKYLRRYNIWPMEILS